MTLYANRRSPPTVDGIRADPVLTGTRTKAEVNHGTAGVPAAPVNNVVKWLRTHRYRPRMFVGTAIPTMPSQNHWYPLKTVRDTC
jgi:hypothetical protein